MNYQVTTSKHHRFLLLWGWIKTPLCFFIPSSVDENLGWFCIGYCEWPGSQRGCAGIMTHFQGWQSCAGWYLCFQYLRSMSDHCRCACADWCTSHQYWIRILFLLHLHQYPLPFVFLIIATLKGGEGISMYFQTGSPWRLGYKDFRCLLAICTLLCENCLSLPYIRYLLGCLILLSFCWVLYILRCQSLSNVYLARLFLHVRNFLHLGVSFVGQTFSWYQVIPSVASWNSFLSY